VSGTDLATYSLVGSLLVFAALGAMAVPALRAARIDPIRALRTE
jgi:ABC-type antimicrobial peptide transport system permease subunit